MNQLPLPFSAPPSYAEADFIEAPANHAALTWLRRTTDWPGGRLIIWGTAGSGKTHLLRIWAARHNAYFWADGPGGPDSALSWPRAPLAIDDADRLPSTDLLHRLNAAAEAGQPVLLASRHRPANWPEPLPDLTSRLLASASAALQPPDDILLRALLARLLSDRQLSLSPSLAEFLLTRLPRHPDALQRAVSLLDQAALAEGRRIGRPTVNAVLAAITTEVDPPPDEDAREE